MNSILLFFISLGATFFGLLILFPILFGLARFFGLYTIVEERECKVYVLFVSASGQNQPVVSE